MADTENREDQKISECLREAFGYSDDQLLKQLDQANETFKDVNFTGAEDRLMKRFLARKAELEKETVSQTPTLVPQNESANIQIAEELPKKTVTVISDAEEKKKNEKKVIRFGKKKVLATAALVAVIAGMLGGTAIGKKNYFFRKVEKDFPTVLVNNDKNKRSESKMEVVYETIAKKLDAPVLRMGYYPEEMELSTYSVFETGAEIKFLYKQHIVIYYLFKNEKSSSLNYESDCNKKYTVYNKWLNQQLEYYVKQYDSGEMECEANILSGNMIYHFSGFIDESDLKKILENLSFF